MHFQTAIRYANTGHRTGKMKSMGYRQEGQVSYDLLVLLVVVAAERTLFMFAGQLS
jgi:hypothetical protein